MSNNLPWPEKHRPKGLNELVGNTDAIRELRAWIESWKSRTPSKKAALLIGPPGIGKTASIGAISNDMNMELVEFNSSDKRNKDSIETLVWRAASQMTLDGRKRLILLDEVDGLSGTSDRGGVGAILKVIRNTVHPIIMTANDPESPRIKDLLKVCLVLRFNPIESEDMETVLKRILSENKESVSQDLIEEIIENAEGDLRAAVSDLESQVRGGFASQGTATSRDIRRGTDETLRHFFASNDLKIARRVLSESDLSHDSLILWLEENLHLHLVTPRELREGFEGLSLADLSLGRIMRGQNWKLLAYFYELLAIGVALSRTETPFRKVEYSQPTWPLLLWQGNRKRDKLLAIQSALASSTGVSSRRIKQTHLDVIQQIIRINPKALKDFAVWLNVDMSSLIPKGRN
ncbi:MAG: replication factor C large subunit [Promethearchaeota archaeon]